MNEEALNRLFILAENDGYKKSFEEFKVLMSSNEDAINTMYGLAKGDGYSKDINEFKTLVGFDQSVKKKDETLPQPGQPSEVIGQPSTGTPAMESGLTLQSPTSTELVSPLDGSTLASEEEQRRKQILESPMYSEEYKAKFATTETPIIETPITVTPTRLPEFVEKQQRKVEVENKFKSLVDSEDIVNKALKIETIDPNVFGDSSFDINSGRWLSFNQNTLTQEEENELIKKGFIKNPQKNNGEYLKPISGEVLYFLPDKINTIKRLDAAKKLADEQYLLKSDGIKPGSIQEEKEADLSMQQKYDVAKGVLTTAGVETNSTNLDKFVDRYKDLLSESLGVKEELTDDQMYELSLKSFNQDPSGEQLTKILQNKMRTQKGNNFNYLLAESLKELSTEPLSKIDLTDEKTFKLTDTQYKFIEEVINARNYLANTRQEEKTNSFRKKVEKGYLDENGLNVDDAKSDMTSYLSDFSELSLSPKDKIILGLKNQLQAAENRNDTKAIEALKKQIQSVDKNYENELFDSRTGMYLSNTAKDIPQRVIDENKRIEEYLAEYSKDDMGSLMKRRDDILMEMFQAAEELKNNLNEELNQIDEYSVIKTDLIKKTGKYGSAAQQLDNNSGNYYSKLKSNPDLYNLFAIINSDGLFDDGELKRARDLQEKYRAINSAIARNEDPGSEYMLSQEGFLNSLGTGFTQGVRDLVGYRVDDPLSDSQKADIVIEEIGRDYELTDSQKEKIENTFSEKAGTTVGGMLPVMGEILVDALIVKKGTSIIGAEKFIEKISKGKKGLEKALKYGLGLAESAATFELAGQGAAAGVGEKLGEDAIDQIFKSITSKNPILKAIIGTVGGTIGEGVAEYSGELVDRIVSGQNYEDAIIDTFGRTPEDVAEKAALTFIAASLMSAPMSTLNALSSKYKESDGKYEGDSPFINAAIELEENKDNDVINALISTQPKSEQDAIQEQTAGQVPVQPETAVSETVEEGTPEAEPEIATEEGKEKINEIEKRRQEELSNYDKEGLNETYAVGSNQTVGEFINSKYDAELKALEQQSTESKKDEVEVGTVDDQGRSAKPGDRLFNDPNPETSEISSKYKQSKGISTSPGKNITELDIDNSMRLADAYEEMQDNPSDPEVQEAYNALAKETVDQYKAMTEAGYEIEIYKGEGEPYANSQEMIDDLKNNKHMYIFSTESGFGEQGITDTQRKENAMLQDSGSKDKNGKPLLINDLFRGVHDFFGHSERGNGFGAKGEENAWDVHARMFTDKARRAMTTETRGQNSWVNFGPQMRNESGQIIKKGEPGYLSATERAFAPQKMGLLPLEFSNIIDDKTEVEAKPEITEGAKKLLDALKPKVDKPNVRKQVDNAKKAIANVSPETKIIVHETSEDYVSSKSGRKQNEGGEYDIDNNTIHINLEAANERTVAHEVFHAILLNKGMSDKQAQSITSRMLDAVKKSASPELTKRLDDFSSKYDEPLQSQESIAELFGILASEYETLPRPTQSLVKRWLDKLAKLFGLKPFTDNEIIDMMNVVSKKIEEGVEIKEKEIKPIRKVDIEKEFEGGIPVDELMNRKQVPEGTPSIESIREKAKELGVSEQDVYIALRNLGYSDAEISTEAKARKAPSADKVLGNKKNKVTVDEMAALKSQIRLEARAARDARIDQVKKKQELATSINEILMKFDKDVAIRTKKFKAISNRINKTNLDNEVSVEKLLNYIEKTFVDAEYGLKLSTANKNATSIRKEINRKRKDPVLLSSAKSFLLIDPSLVDDIDAYLEISNKITNGFRPTSITDTKTNVSQGFIVSDVDAYTEEALEIQDEKLLDALDKQIDQITELEIKAKEEMTKTNIKKVFDYYSLLAKQMVTTNKDPFTGDDIDIDPETKTLIERLINVDPLSIKKEDAIKAIEAINNFLVNQSTSNIQSIVEKFEGVELAIEEVNKGTKSRDLRLFSSKGFGRVIDQYFTGLPLIFEKIFGKTPGLRIMRAMGLTDIIQGKSKAIKTIQGILNSYNDTFLKTKPNGESFNTSYNITERGMVAFMRRHIPGLEQVDFNKRKSLIKQSIDELKSNGDKDQVKKAEIYEEVYNKILKGVNNIKQLESKVDKTNLEAVDWWTKEWSKHYDQLSIVNREVYNEILDKDNNYTPDVFSSMGDVEVDLDRSSFFNTSNYVNKKKTGSLIQSTRPSELPKGRYVNLDFDFNNANALLGALQDINTASSIMKLDGFLNSDAFKNLIKSNDDRRLIVDRIKAYINDMKGSNMYSYDELKNVAKAINFVSSVGVSKALGGGAQVLKQTMPVALNTMINAGQINLLATTNPSYISWLNKVGSGVSIRGLESTADVERLNSLIERAADSKFEVATKYIKKANDLWLNIFLKNPDVWIAKSSFQAYYKQSLKRQGLEYKNIDWDTHETNKEAVDYAQNQVDRQQNFSDVALQGKLFTDKNQVLQLVRKIVFPFAGFRMNQKSRMYSDFINLWRGDSSKQDRIDSVRSLGGLAVEQVAFLTIGALIKTLITSIAYSWIGENEDEEDRKKRIDQYLKGAKSNATLDLLSPIPQTDFLITGGYNKLIDVFQKDLPEDERGYIYDQEGRPREVLDDLGTIGIAAKEVDALLEMSGMAYDGKYTTEYFGIKKEKKIDDKSDMTLPAIFQALYVGGVLPKDFSDFAKFTTKAIKKEKTK